MVNGVIALVCSDRWFKKIAAVSLGTLLVLAII